MNVKSCSMSETNVSRVALDESNCKVCQLEFQESDQGILCDSCEYWTHAKCLKGGLSSYKNERKRLIWTCSDACRNEFPKTISQEVMDIDTNKATISDVLIVMRSILLEFRGIRNNDSRVVILKNTVDDLKKEIEQVKINLSEKEDTIEGLKEAMIDLKQERINNKAICVNIPKTIANDKASFTQLLIKNNFQTQGTVGQIFNAKKHSDHCNVMVEFPSPAEKIKFIKEVKEKKPILSGSNKLYVVECLTYEKKKLLMEAKVSLKEYKYIWSKNGRIFVQKDGEEAVLIKNSKMISDLCNQTLSVTTSDTSV